MKHIKLYEEFINEATTDGTIESLISVSKIAAKMKVFDDDLFREMKDTMINGINGAVRGEAAKLPTDKKKEFEGYADALMDPLRKTNNLAQFISSLKTVAAAKDNIINRLQLEESLMESRAMDILKKVKDKTVEWWNTYGKDIALVIAEILVRLIVEVLFAVLRALLKSDNLKAPKISFGGGKFGGGGASGKW